MFNRVASGLLVLTVVFSPVLAVAATPEEAKALLNEAVAFYETNGKDKTFAEINNPKGNFVPKATLFEENYISLFTIVTA